MKTIISILAVCLVCGCERKADQMLEAGRDNILKQAVTDRDKAERRVNELEKENSELSLQLSITENRLKLATDSAALYERLLDDSNEAKLRRAKEMLDEAIGK